MPPLVNPSSLSISEQMRRKYADKMTVGQIARLFNVSYHHAYAVVRYRRGAQARAPRPHELAAAGYATAPSSGSGEVANVEQSEEELFAILAAADDSKRGKSIRHEATNVLDALDDATDPQMPEEKRWQTRYEAWKATRKADKQALLRRTAQRAVEKAQAEASTS